jgi:hypothetical protein
VINKRCAQEIFPAIAENESIPMQIHPIPWKVLAICHGTLSNGLKISALYIQALRQMGKGRAYEEIKAE